MPFFIVDSLSAKHRRKAITGYGERISLIVAIGCILLYTHQVEEGI